MLYMMTHIQARWCNDNTLDVYLEYLPFKSLLEHQLPRLRFFGDFSQPYQMNSRMGYDYFLPNPLQFMSYYHSQYTVTY